MNEAKFLADRYEDGRPDYPSSMYRLLLEPLRASAPVIFLDLACGTGKSTRSFAKLGLATKGMAVDIDPEMIAVAKKALQNEPLPIEFLQGTAENIPVDSHSIDLVLVASAIHWFRIEESKKEIERVLRPGGHLFVYEYQFPKSVDDFGLNDRIRRRFNQEWKAPAQSPRGKLKELLRPFFADRNVWCARGDDRPQWIEKLTLEAFLRNLFSQSRYLHAEAASGDPARYRESIRDVIYPHFNGTTLSFDFNPRAFCFQKL